MSRIEALLRRFGRDRSGVSALEFALIAPLMLTVYLGTVEVTQGLAMDRLVKLNASTITNLVAQYTTISTSRDMPDLFKATSQIMAAYPTAAPATVVSCISIDKNGNPTVAWSQTSGGTARTVGSSVTLPAALKKPNTQLIMGETTMSYHSAIQFIPIGTWNLYGVTYMFPRASTNIVLTS
ncbi:MAG: TadE/TadG family type IV pilus assembly protein [Phenylobacterium sp.]